MSQIFYLCPSLNFIKCRLLFTKNYLNLPVFCHKIKTSPIICPENFIHLYEILSEMCSQKKIKLKNHVLIHNFTIQ